MSGQNNANLQFHSDCSNYFDSLREKGETDFEFEDEYFFTLPAISQMIELSYGIWEHRLKNMWNNIQIYVQ